MGNTTLQTIFRTFLLAAFLLTAAGCSKAPTPEEINKALSEGMTAYRSGNFAGALEKFKPIAEKGDARAQFSVGVMYNQGQGVAQDVKQAIAWWEKAAEQGHPEAQDNLGLRYAKGQGVTQDWVQAYKWFAIAAASGNQTAMGNQKVIAMHMPPEKLKEAQLLADEWVLKHKK